MATILWTTISTTCSWKKVISFEGNFTKYTSTDSQNCLVSCGYLAYIWTNPAFIWWCRFASLPMWLNVSANGDIAMDCLPTYWGLNKLFTFFILTFSNSFPIWFLLIVIENSHQGQIINRSTLLQVEARYWTADKPISEPLATWFMLPYLNYKALID